VPIITLNDSNYYIDTEHHFKVSAGPGAGKTRWLINHIKHVLHKSDRLGSCRKLACITYTTVGVETIIKRLGDFVDRVEVSTIHSFLYKHVVKPYLFLIATDYGIDPSKIDGHDDIVPTSGLIHLWKSKTKQFFLSDDKSVSSQLSNLFWAVDNNNELTLNMRNPWTKQGYSIRKNTYIDYKKVCWERGVLHHDDVLFFSLELIKREPSILRVLRTKFPYYFLDEFQDTNPIQTKILEQIAHSETIVGVIGDKAQSIYEFQGADARQFEEFALPEMRYYNLTYNYRSTEDIIKVLNHTRTDLRQISPSSRRGNKPIVLTGHPFEAFSYLQEMIGEENICCLSYSNLTANQMKHKYTSGTQYENYLLKILIEDSDSRRPKVIRAAIRAIEYGRQNRIKEAIHELNKFIAGENFEKQKKAVKIIKLLLENYQKFCDRSLYDFHYFLLEETEIHFSEIRRNEKKPSRIQMLYDSILFKDAALSVNIQEDEGLYRTIHKSKGEQFENVLVIVLPQGGKPYKEDKDLSFLLKPSIDEVNHRVFYVAMSRAMNNLYVNVPSLSSKNHSYLKEVGFDIVGLGENNFMDARINSI
jgi:DNA helicase-2/ATP-dependent DNA helicase PcrA